MENREEVGMGFGIWVFVKFLGKGWLVLLVLVWEVEGEGSGFKVGLEGVGS